MQETEYAKFIILRSVPINVVLPAPEGAETTKRMPEWLADKLFNIGKLFANAIEFGFCLDDMAADHGAGGF